MIRNLIILFIIAASTFFQVVGKVDDSIHNTINPEKTAITWTASWSYDDQLAAVGNDHGELAIYETTNWEKVKNWKFPATTIARVEWNPRYPVLAVAGISHEGNRSIVQLFNVATNEIIKFLPDSVQGRGVTWSPDGEKVAFVSTAGGITIYSKNGDHLKTLSFINNASLFDIDWHPTKNLLLAVEEQIYLIDIDGDSLLATYDDGSKNKGILCCQWHTSGNYFVTGDYGHENEGGEPSYIKYWTSDGKLMRRIKESKFEYRNVKWTRDGKYLAAAADVLLVLSDKGEVIRKTKFDDQNLWGVEWNKQGNKIITSNQVGNIRISDTSGKVLKAFKQGE